MPVQGPAGSEVGGANTVGLGVALGAATLDERALDGAAVAAAVQDAVAAASRTAAKVRKSSRRPGEPSLLVIQSSR